ncbi:hypothetical protein AADEFJLK_00051 [Methylovulum psychrotolerans]|uniref:Uncharacterized protein n=2 Tax=Methylovulum psychrotolerans TaxID=1704499 RepID=A0A2S5CQL3_9GAMM|nr:hypothetical protein AADEFJLK_00051 [Methylovulum psychrotolerans]
MLLIMCSLSSGAWAHGGGGGGHGGGGWGGGHGGGGFGGGGHSGGFGGDHDHWHGGWGGGWGGYRGGWGWRGGYYGGLGLGFYGLGYGYPYYGGYGYGYPATVVTAPVTPPVYIQQTPPVTQRAPGYWYYCTHPAGYYPYIKACPSGWQPVAPTPPAP